MTDVFERTGTLVHHGDEDLRGRPDCVEFTARSGTALLDHVGEIFVTVERWGSRSGVATVQVFRSAVWQTVASSLPFDAMYLTREQEIRLVLGSYAVLQPGERCRLHLAGAVVASPTIRLVSIVKSPVASSGRAGFKRVRKAS